MKPSRVFVGMGSSLGERLQILREVVAALDKGELESVRLVACSRVYETRPVGAAENRFLNAAVELETSLSPQVLMASLHRLEQAHGRTRRVRWEDRSLDLDLLWMSDGEGALSLDDAELKIPHPELTFRDFVLAPLADLAPDLELRGLSVRETLHGLADGQRTIEATLLASLQPG